QADELAPAEPVDAPAIAELEVDADRLDRLLVEVRHADQRDVVDRRVLLARVSSARDEVAKVDVPVLVAAADHLTRGDLVDVVRDLDRVPVGRKAEALGPRRPVYEAEGLRLRLLRLDIRGSVRERRDAVRDGPGRVDQVVRDVADAAGAVELLAHRRGADVLRDRR